MLNGTGALDQATTTSAALGQLGFNMVGVGDTPPVGEQAETLVTYAQRNAVDEAAAQAVAQSLSGAVIMAYGKTTDGAQVTVTTGTDFTVDSPAPPPTTGAHKAAAATTALPSSPSTSATASANAAFSSPTQAVQALAPWDPRSCSAIGGEGT